MPDQAAHLRRLVRSALQVPETQPTAAPRMLGVVGAGSGAGASTVALHLALASAEQGLRTVLVDAASDRNDLAQRCGIAPRTEIVSREPLSDDLHELITIGPAGIQLVPELWRESATLAQRSAELERRWEQFHSLGRHADAIVFDFGRGDFETIARHWAAPRDYVLVASPQADSIRAAYDIMKHRLFGKTVTAWMNSARDRAEALDAFFRLDRSCRRFLGRSITWGGRIPHDPQAAEQAISPLLRESLTEHMAKFLAPPEEPRERASA